MVGHGKGDVAQKVHPAFGRFVRKHRRARDLTQEQLAALLDYSDGFISQIEAGLRLPDFRASDFLERWSRALNVTPEQLRTGGELSRYNVFPDVTRERSEGDEAILASVGHLDDPLKWRIADGLRVMFGEVPASQSALPDQADLEAVKEWFRQLPEEEAQELLAQARLSAAGEEAPTVPVSAEKQLPLHGLGHATPEDIAEGRRQQQQSKEL